MTPQNKVSSTLDLRRRFILFSSRSEGAGTAESRSDAARKRMMVLYIASHVGVNKVKIYS